MIESVVPAGPVSRGSNSDTQASQSVAPSGTSARTGSIPYAATISSGVGTTSTTAPSGIAGATRFSRSAWITTALASESSKT